MANWRNEAVVLDPRWAELKSWDIVWYLKDGIHHTEFPTMAYYVETESDKLHVQYAKVFDMSISNTYGRICTVEAYPGYDVFLTKEQAKEALQFYKVAYSQCDDCKYDFCNYPKVFTCSNCTKTHCRKPDYLSDCDVQTPYGFCQYFEAARPINFSYDASLYWNAINACTSGVDCAINAYLDEFRPSFVKPRRPRKPIQFNYIINRKVGEDTYKCILPMNENNCGFDNFDAAGIVFTSKSYWKGKQRPTRIVEKCNYTLRQLCDMEDKKNEGSN